MANINTTSQNCTFFSEFLAHYEWPSWSIPLGAKEPLQLQIEVLEDYEDLEATAKFNKIAQSKFAIQKLIHYIRPE